VLESDQNIVTASRSGRKTKQRQKTSAIGSLRYLTERQLTLKMILTALEFSTQGQKDFYLGTLDDNID
jgi:hypothetical protein